MIFLKLFYNNCGSVFDKRNNMSIFAIAIVKRSRGRAARQWSAKPSTAVRIRS